jgi:hypothetical protein
MKRLLSYGLPVAALILHIAVISAYIPIPGRDAGGVQNGRLCYSGDTDSTPSKEGRFYLMPDAPFIPVGLNSVPNSRVPVSFLKTVNHPYSTLKSCLSNLTHQQIHIIRSAFFLHYSKKEKDGYYIYALRKLLI